MSDHAGKEKQREDALELVRDYLNHIRYGSITLVLQDGVVVQVEHQEKVRLK